MPLAQVTEAGAAAAKLIAESATPKVHINKRYIAVDEYMKNAGKKADTSFAGGIGSAQSASTAKGSGSAQRDGAYPADTEEEGLIAAEDEPKYGAE